jgi:hypothetical protein
MQPDLVIIWEISDIALTDHIKQGYSAFGPPVGFCMALQSNLPILKIYVHIFLIFNKRHQILLKNFRKSAS